MIVYYNTTYNSFLIAYYNQDMKIDYEVCQSRYHEWTDKSCNWGVREKTMKEFRAYLQRLHDVIILDDEGLD